MSKVNMSDMTRREAFSVAGKTALGGALASLALTASPATELVHAAAPQTKQWGMLVDLHRCIGCQGCTVACKAENDVPLGVFRRRVRTVREGRYPNAGKSFFPISCFHCAEPACLKKCPSEAIFKNEEGFVLVDASKCEKKKKCTVVCPYQNIFINPVTEKADKCTFCEHRVTHGVAPACVQTCTGGALQFGDLSDANSAISKAIRANHAKVLKPEAGTKPSFYYIGLEAEVEERLRKMMKRGQLKPVVLESDI